MKFLFQCLRNELKTLIDCSEDETEKKKETNVYSVLIIAAVVGLVLVILFVVIIGLVIVVKLIDMRTRSRKTGIQAMSSNTSGLNSSVSAMSSIKTVNTSTGGQSTGTIGNFSSFVSKI